MNHPADGANVQPDKSGHGRFRQFRPTSFVLEHRISVLVAIVVITLMGLTSYLSIPRESNPEIKIPIYVINTIYSGVSPADIENLITQPIEDELNTIPDIKEITSVSVEGYSSISAEFDPDVDLTDALQKVREKVDLAKPELPAAAEDPTIIEIDFSDFPIMEVNVSGEYDLVRLKEVAENIQDKIETNPAVREVTLSGGLEREVQINVDLAKLKYYGLDFQDVVDAIAFENVTVPGGSIDVGEKKYLVRIPGEFEEVQPIEEVVIDTRDGRPIYVRDVAVVDFGFEERDSYARLDGEAVVTLGIKKRTGENIIATSDAVKEVVNTMLPALPPTTRIEITSDQSDDIRDMVSNLENNIVSGLLLVLLVLLLFLGVRNATFAALSIPLSMLLSFVVIQAVGFSLNVVVLFSLILALGMLVDNAVVVVENIYRYIEAGTPNFEAARKAVGEVAGPVIAATATTLAAFAPMAFWPGIVGEFMKFLPLTLIITLSASLVVALLIIPVLCAMFMRRPDVESASRLTRLGIGLVVALLALVLAGIAGRNPLTAVLLVATAVGLWALQRTVLGPLNHLFQERLLPAMLASYRRQLTWTLHHRFLTLLATGGVFIATLVLFGLFSKGTVFFPEDIPPALAWVQVEAPLGTRVERVDQITQEFEAEINAVDGHQDIEAVVATSGGASSSDGFGSRGSHLATISLNFIDYKDRTVDAFDTLEELRQGLATRAAGADVSVEIPQGGPPTGRPVHVEFIGEDFDVLRELANRAVHTLQQSDVWFKLDGLESDLEAGRPELRVRVNRERAALYGLSTQDIGWTVRSAINGVVASTFREGDDEIDMRVRLAQRYRDQLSALGELQVVNDMGEAVPLSSLASWSVEEGLGGINRKDLNRVATVSSDVRAGHNNNAVVAEVAELLEPLFADLPAGYEARFGGQQEDQAESQAFLSRAFVLALMLIAFILISQFNSVIKPFVILTSVIMSTVGVLLGLLILQMPFGIIMSGVGVIALAGIVVNNAIVLIDYIELLRRRDGLGPIESLVKAGATRFRPVILTAITTIGGMIPLAIGLNFDFQGLYTSLSPELFWGGEQAAWWGPLAIAVIFGLAFATFLTLVVVPVLISVLDDGVVKLMPRLVRRRGHDPAPEPQGEVAMADVPAARQSS